MENLYRRKFPTRNFHQKVTDVLRMSPSQFSQFQSAAGQYLGETVLHPKMTFPNNKLLPSAVRTVKNISGPGTLAAMMNLENIAHNDPTKEWHSGGGLTETASSLFNGLWQTAGFGPEFQNWFGFFDYDSEENKISSEDVEVAQMLQQSYKTKDDRVSEIGDWVRDSSMGDERFTVWVDTEDNEVSVALRGTVASMGDLQSDLGIIWNNTSGEEQERDIYNFLQDVQKKYPDSTLEASGHSLGSNQLINVFEEHKDLDYARVNVFSPGTNPMWSLDDSKAAVADERFHFYLNSGDLLSNTFVSLIPDGRDNVYWSKPSHSPLQNHGIQQWVDTI